MEPIILSTADVITFSDQELYRLCVANRNIRIERDSLGNLILMSPAGGETSSRNSILIAELVIWNRKKNLGKVFDSSGGFILPNGAMRSPDAAWIPLEWWQALDAVTRKQFLPLCPDFVVELRSPSDRVADVRKKMLEWIENGCRLAWLLDPEQERAYVYRANGEHDMADSFEAVLSGEEVLPGFLLAFQAVR